MSFVYPVSSEPGQLHSDLSVACELGKEKMADKPVPATNDNPVSKQIVVIDDTERGPKLMDWFVNGRHNRFTPIFTVQQPRVMLKRYTRHCDNCRGTGFVHDMEGCQRCHMSGLVVDPSQTMDMREDVSVTFVLKPDSADSTASSK